MEAITVFSTFNPGEADLVKSRLDAAGFDATIVNEEVALTLAYGDKGGILVQVPDDEAAEAKALLEAQE